MAPRAIDRSRLLAVVDDPRSESDLRKYFAPDLPPGQVPPYTGGRFELLAGGGDRAATADLITADDLIAVQMLSMRVPGEVALDLLEGELGRDVAEQLAQIPTDVTIADEDAADLLMDGGPADTAWHLLEEPDGMGWVTAGKLLARKRPHLIPVYDSVVRCAYGHPPKFWTWLQPLFATNEGLLNSRLVTVRDKAGVPAEVSPLRVLDVIVWMHHRDTHLRRACPGLPQ